AGMSMPSTDIYSESLRLTKVIVYHGGAIGANVYKETTTLDSRVINESALNAAVRNRDEAVKVLCRVVFSNATIIESLSTDLLRLVFEYMMFDRAEERI